MMVAAGDIKLAVVNKSIATAIAKQLKNIDVNLDISLSQFQAWTLAKENTALRDSLDSWLNNIDQNLIDQMKNKYLGK